MNLESGWSETWLDAATIHQDLTQFVDILQQRHSYFLRYREEFFTAFEHLQHKSKAGLTRGQLTLELELLLHLLRDAHSKIHPKQISASVGGSRLSFSLELSENRWVALTDKTLLLSDFPFLKSLDGLPLELWLEVTKPMALAGSEAFQQLRAGLALKWLGYFRQQLGLADSKTVQIELESVTGAIQTLQLPTLQTGLERHKADKPLMQKLESNIGYLCLQEMDDSPEFLNSLIPAMHQLQHTKGLIIDVRGNGGGTRHALRLLFPFFLHPDDPPRLYTVATLRIPENETRDDPEGYLADRFLYPLTSSVWSVTEQEFVQAFAAKFKVTWQPPQEQFSALHYGILTHNQDHFYYSQPVIVLHNQRCASATDIFLGAFKGWRNTTLIGLNSAGTSGRPRQYTLEQSGIRFMASSMVSYRPDGQLYEGLGTQADIELGVTMTDLQGQTDSVLEAALKRLTT